MKSTISSKLSRKKEMRIKKQNQKKRKQKQYRKIHKAKNCFFEKRKQLVNP